MATKKTDTEAKEKTGAMSAADLEALKAAIKAEVMAEIEEENAPDPVPPEILKEIEENEQLVKIRLFKDYDKYKDDVYVGINGRNWNIKRGVEVEVPKKVALVLMNSDIQRGLAADYMDSIDKPQADD